jgi:hypothetical protein
MKIVIVPYRDRIEHLTFFQRYLPAVLENYELMVVHQNDARPFNRGAMKNIGFLAVKQKYPTEYLDATLIFQDVDIMPYKSGVFDYVAEHGVVHHFYGYESCLSACFAIKGADFEKANGFPNLWEWGVEDFIIQERVLKSGCRIDRSHFYPVGSRQVLQFFDGMTRTLSMLDVDQIRTRHAMDGLSSLKAEFSLEENFVQVTKFAAMYLPDQNRVVRNIKDLGVNTQNRKKDWGFKFDMK